MEEYKWIINDVCLCGNKENCPNKDNCKRAAKRKAGIYTVSLFYEEGKECEYYIPIIERGDK